MKKIIVLLIILTLFLGSQTTFAETDLNFKGHWAEGVIDQEFIKEHFNYLLKEDIKVSDLNNTLDKKYFLLSLYTILNKDQKEEIDQKEEKTNIEDAVKYLTKKEILEEEESIEGKLTRKDAVKYIIKTMELSSEIELADTSYMPFKDIIGLSDEYKMYISKASMVGIAKGYGDSTFRPDDNITAIESILFLQRLEGEIEEMDKNIPFKVVEQNWEGHGVNNLVTIKQSSNKVQITLTKEFPTTGYNMTVARVEKYAPRKYRIHLNIKAPEPDKIVLQVISYKNITIEIDRKLLDSGSCTFEIAGSSSNIKTK